MKYEKFNLLDIGKELLKQQPQRSICKLVDIIGVKMFTQILLNEKLQGESIRFPGTETLRKVVMRAQIRDELKGLSERSEKFKSRVAELARYFGVYQYRILYEYDIVRGKKRK